MWWLPAAAAPTVRILGDDLQLVDHCAELRAALPGASCVSTERPAPAATTLEGPPGVDPAQYLAPLPVGAPVVAGSGDAVVIRLGADLDAGRAPAPSADPSALGSGAFWLYGLALDPEGFEGPALVVRERSAGCCDAPPDEVETIWIVDPGVRREGYVVRLALAPPDLERLLAERTSWEPAGRAPALAARRQAHPWAAAAVGAAGPGGRVEVAARGVDVTPTAEGWTLHLPADRCPAPTWLDVTVTPTGGPPHRVRTDVSGLLCADPLGVGDVRVRALWSASGDAAALLMDGPMRMARRLGTVVALPLARAGVEILGDAASVADAVRAAGHRVVRVGPTAGPHAAIEVFWRAGFEAEARVLAARLGAARVAPMDWDAAGDLVVATP